jgi:hypothetical protein
MENYSKVIVYYRPRKWKRQNAENKTLTAIPLLMKNSVRMPDLFKKLEVTLRIISNKIEHMFD